MDGFYSKSGLSKFSLSNRNYSNNAPEHAAALHIPGFIVAGESGKTLSSVKRDEPVLTDPKKQNDKKAEKTPTPKRVKYNGRIVALNAVLRAAPTIEAGEIAIVQFDEFVKIGQRAGANSPWFRVVTASGRVGWIHGNTFEFVG